MSEFNDKNKDLMNNPEPPDWQAGQTPPPLDTENLSEEDIYRILQEDAAGIEPPESLSPAAIEQRLKGVVQESRPRRSPWLIVAGMAACLVFGVMAGLLAYSLIDGKKETVRETAVADNNSSGDTGNNANIDTTETEPIGDGLTYDSVCDIINSYNANHQNAYKYDDVVYEMTEDAVAEEAAPAAADESNGGAQRDFAKTGQTSDDYSRTDEQVTGVEEGDIVKTDGKHIFTIESSTFGFMIHVITPDGIHSKEVGSVEVAGGNCQEMYLTEDKLFTIGTRWGESERAITQITVIDIHDAEHPEVLYTHTQSGRFNTSRICDGHLYTFTEDVYERVDNYDKNEPQYFIPELDGQMVEETRIAKAGEDDTNNYMVMTSLNIQDPQNYVDRLAILGGGATYYVSTEHIYIARYTSTDATRFGQFFFGDSSPVTSLTKFTYNDGKFTKNRSTTFRGMIGNSYYMHEYQGNFCFVYTSQDYESGESVNGLCVLDGEMNKLGELRNIAPGEQIYASYYMDNMAYFVTYRNTDPVFAVDISNPEKPELKSELKLPGFSSYLHSFGENTLLGIGYGDASADGNEWDNTAKLSLFSIGQDYDLKEISKTFAEKYARHIADQNHRAVFVDETRGIVGLGLTCYNYESSDAESRILKHYVCYQKKGNKLIKVMDTVDGKDGLRVQPQSIRGVRIGEIFYVCDPTGVVTAYEISSDGGMWKKAK